MNRVLITQRINKDKYGEYYDYLESNYIKFFNSFNIDPILLPNNIKDVIEFYKQNKCNKIILTGGDDIFELSSSKNNKEEFFKRDKNERQLIAYAVDQKVPMFCICRGFQLVNLVLGGQLTKNIINKDVRSHKVVINKGYANITYDKITVNSFHNHGIKNDQLSSELSAFGYSEDLKYIELYEHKDLPIIGIQWHPERENKSKKFDQIIFNKFLMKK